MKRVFTNSEFSAYQDCPQKWDFKYRQMLEPNRESDLLSFGRIVHYGLEQLFKAGLDCALANVVKEFTKANYDDFEVLNAQMKIAEHILIMYSKIIEQDEFKVVEIEKEYMVSIPTLRGNNSNKFEYKFKLDQLLSKPNGKLLIREFKTANTIDSGYLENLMLDEQINRYIWAAEKALGQEIEGVVYDVFRKAVPKKPALLKNGTLSQDKRQDTTYQLYLQTIKDNGLNENDYSEILELLKNKGNSFFHREIILKNASEKEKTAERLYILASTMSANPPIYKCPSRDCSWKCAYRNICIEYNDDAVNALFHKRDAYHPEYAAQEKKIAQGGF
jgi:hypothetical protein